MALHDPELEYMPRLRKNGDVVTDKNGNTVYTMSIKLYAPDGDVYGFPQGCSPLRMISKGYLTHATPEWKEKAAIFEKNKADSVRLSQLQGQVRNRKKAIEAEEKLQAEIKAMESLDAELTAKEDALKGIEPVVAEAPLPDIETVSAPKPKAKSKARPKATAKV